MTSKLVKFGVHTDNRKDDEGYASMGCGYLGCINVGTISHGTDGKSSFYCRNHFKNLGAGVDMPVTSEVGKGFLSKIYAELNKRKRN